MELKLFDYNKWHLKFLKNEYYKTILPLERKSSMITLINIIINNSVGKINYGIKEGEKNYEYYYRNKSKWIEYRRIEERTY